MADSGMLTAVPATAVSEEEKGETLLQEDEEISITSEQNDPVNQGENSDPQNAGGASKAVDTAEASKAGKAPNSDSGKSAVANESPSVVQMHVRGRTFSLPRHLFDSDLFKQSVLGKMVLWGSKPSGCNCDVQLNSNGEWTIEREPEDFGLMVAHLAGKKPIEAFSCTTVCQNYMQLVNELEFWGFDHQEVSLPNRLWTRTRWSDLTGFYSQSLVEKHYLEMRPAAVQLPDGTIQGIRVLDRLQHLTEEVEQRLPPEASPNQILAIYCWGGYLVVLCDTDRPAAILNHYPYARPPYGTSGSETLMGASRNFQNQFTGDRSFSRLRSASTRTPFVGSASGSGSPQANQDSSKGVNEDPSQTAVPNVTTIFATIPSSDKVLAFDVSKSGLQLSIPKDGIFPHLHRRGDRHFLWMSTTFGLEVQEIKDSQTGTSKIRCAFISAKSFPSAAPHLIHANPDLPAPTSGWAAGKGQAAKEPPAWQCFHPTLGCRYGGNTRWIRDLGDFRKVRLFPWGALFVQHRVENPFGVISIDDPAYRNAYGSKIAIYIRGIDKLEKGAIPRDALDVIVTPKLERVYLLCCNQLASIAVTHNTPKLQFELAKEEPGKRPSFKYVHLDVPDGAPSGDSLGHLHCLGMLSEFDIATGLYTQNMLCAVMCPKYNRMKD